MAPSATVNQSVEAIHTRQNNNQIIPPQSLYGVGVRTGSYLQGFAFVIGFTYLDDLEPRSQFSGVILALQLLVRWWNKHNTHTASLSELWEPSCSSSRIELLASFGVLTGVGATSITYALTVTNKVVHFKDQPVIVDGIVDPIWLFKAWSAQGTAMVVFMWTQAGVTILLEAVPYLIYLAAWATYVRDYYLMKIARRSAPRHSQQVEDWRENPGRMDRFIDWIYSWPKESAQILLYSLACTYVVILVFSVERTIAAADLGPTGRISDPAQILSFVTGVLAAVTAVASACNRFSMVAHPVSMHRLLDGRTLTFYKDGRYYKDGEWVFDADAEARQGLTRGSYVNVPLDDLGRPRTH
ncbi:hypothetical protein LTR62_003187 [Meristemomyces frigidus]|uniref:Uncharacterized protein n=1 Tax=Meristemomyces frigidus TaxID=1508187 RepID=A0AAN7YH82_9PEZI|nr:hypothetical protein LTR62_003187 [Meristemomyces frigidus]